MIKCYTEKGNDWDRLKALREENLNCLRALASREAEIDEKEAEIFALKEKGEERERVILKLSIRLSELEVSSSSKEKSVHNLKDNRSSKSQA